jgi:HSP20 family protein
MRRNTPFSDFDDLFERMTRGFEDTRHDIGGFGRGIDLDIAEYDDELVVMADLPGFDREDLDVSVSDGTLTIRAEGDYEHDAGDDHYVHRERRHDSVSRSVRLPVEVHEDEASATYTNGVLTVTLPVVVEDVESGHRIDID